MQQHTITASIIKYNSIRIQFPVSRKREQSELTCSNFLNKNDLVVFRAFFVLVSFYVGTVEVCVLRVKPEILSLKEQCIDSYVDPCRIQEAEKVRNYAI